MAKMKVAVIPKAHGEFEIVERDVPSPDKGRFASALLHVGSATATN